MTKAKLTALEKKLALGPGALAWTCPPGCLKFTTTDDIKPPAADPGDDHCGIVGQRRAVDALALGLEIKASGYNVFVTGPVGTGRTTTVRQLLTRYERAPRRLDDKCYVNNFKDPDQPILLRLAAGAGRRFARELDEFVEYLAANLPNQFESEAYQHSRAAIVESFKERGGGKVREFEKKVAAAGFALVQVAPFVKPELAPIVEKQPAKMDALPALVDEGRLTMARADEIRKSHRELTGELAAIFKEIRGDEREAREALEALDRGVVEPVLGERLGDIADHHPGEKVKAWLDDVKESILGNIDLFRSQPQAEKPAPGAVDPYLEYRVNVLVDNRRTKGAPIVFETNPNYKNLFGTIERVVDRSGQWRTDFTKVKAGSVLRADGGFLVLNALDVLVEPGVWPALKRTLRNRRLEISAYEPFLSMLSLTAMKPEQVAIDIKVVMVGDPYVYSVLAAYDEDFRKIFKVRADFDWVMDLDDHAIGQYSRVIKLLCDNEKLLPFDRSGVKRVVEHGVRLAGRQDKLSTRFNIVGDVLKEASYWAARTGAKRVRAAHVQQAIDGRRERVRLYEDKLQELIDRGTVFIATAGRAQGQVNGLAVYDTGEHAFGKPARITAKTGVGAAGIINIERESALSGPTHDKGVYILTGYLRNKYARRRPLVMSASITFEQSYGGVDGDSASSTEVYALLSDLAGLGIRQDLAVTGSVDQHGRVQPIGGVNEKVEGFYEVCVRRGLTGRQGVIIPKANAGDLMLRPDVVEAVGKGKFHVYAVETIDDGIELLTGVPAGKASRGGAYPPGSVHDRVAKRLEELAELQRRYEGDGAKPAAKKRGAGLRKRGEAGPARRSPAPRGRGRRSPRA
ncbi:MAG: AAA family ATPase [bacterium]